MRFVVFCTAAFCLTSTPILAQDCSPTALAVGAELRTEIGDLSNTVTKLQSRAEGQIFQVTDLPASAQAKVPDLPMVPVFADGFIDADGALTWACDADGNPTPTADDYRLAIASFSAAIGTYETQVAARADAIAALAEIGDAQTADAAEPDAAPEDDPAPADDDAPDVAQNEDDDGTEPAPAPEAVAQATPMPDPDNPNLFRRALSLPSASLRTEPRSDAPATPLPTFSVMYVFDESSANGGDWLQVSTSLREGTQGWVPANQTLSWANMLVMEFAPKGKRSDVLFFKDDTTLADIVGSFSYAAEASEIYDSIEAERNRLAGGGDGIPQWDQRLVAMEPAVGVSFGNQPYLLPILDWKPELFDGTTETNLLQVAAVPADAQEIATSDTQSFDIDLNEAAAQDGVFRVGVVFVVDTTISMRPFIERTYDAIQSFYDSFQQFESASFVSFSLMGFRDQVEATPGIEYTTRLFQPLDPEAPAAQVLGNMRAMEESASPTLEFKEDGLAGVVEAIEQNDWSPYDARLIVYISDASVRSGDDPLARYIGQTPQSVAELARNNGVAILPIHLLTPANQRNGDAAEAEAQYRVLAATGDINAEKYIALDAEDATTFSQEVSALSTQLARSIFEANSGSVLSVDEQLELEEVPEGGRLAAAAANEIFRAQLESLATAVDGSAPNFLAGWTSDRDLLDPQLETLEVKVFLTRNQLSSLDKQLGSIIDAFRSGGDDPQAFFDNLQALAAQTATDPDVVRADEREAMRAILPTFLQNLPYRSEVLDLDREYWGSLSDALRSEFMEQLDGKRKSYQAIFEQTDLWQDFGSDDPLLQVTPVRLSVLP